MEFFRSIFSFLTDRIANESTIDLDDENDDSIPPMKDIESNDLFVYLIQSDTPDSTYQTEYWCNTLSTGKEVILLITTIFTKGIFEIELTDSEKEIILRKETIVLNEYNCSNQKLWNGSQQCHDIENKHIYTEKELRQINNLLFWADSSEDESYDYIYDSDTEYHFGLDLFEENGWILVETVYGFDSGCELKPIDS